MRPGLVGGLLPGRRRRIRRVHGEPNSGGTFTAGANCGSGDRIWYPNGTAGITFHGAVCNQTLRMVGVNVGRYTW